MEIKVNRDTTVVIAMSGEEANALMALLNLPRRGVLPIADDIYDALIDQDFVLDMDANTALGVHFVETYGVTE